MVRISVSQKPDKSISNESFGYRLKQTLKDLTPKLTLKSVKPD